MHFTGSQSDQPIIVRFEIISAAPRSGGNAEPGISLTLGRHDSGGVGNTHIIYTVSGVSRKGMFVISDLFGGQIDQTQFENHRIFLFKADRFIQMDVILAAPVTVLEKSPFHSGNAFRISFFQYFIAFCHINQRNQPCGSHFRSFGYNIIRKVLPVGSFTEYHGCVSLFV